MLELVCEGEGAHREPRRPDQRREGRGDGRCDSRTVIAADLAGSDQLPGRVDDLGDDQVGRE
jgi:hypothetical protein